jgi:anion-transporting  ArsA/GET3 family ATPase
VTFRRQNVACTDVNDGPACDHHDQVAVCKHEQTLKEQQKRIDEQKEMISKQAHLAVQSIQEEQQLKSSLKEKDKEIDYLHAIVINQLLTH